MTEEIITTDGEKIETDVFKKKLICPDCEEEIDHLELEVQTTKIKRLKPSGNGGNWDNVNPVKEYEDDVNPIYLLVCPKCDHEFLSQQEPLNSDENFDEMEAKMLNGTLTQEDLEAVYK